MANLICWLFGHKVILEKQSCGCLVPRCRRCHQIVPYPIYV